jgi:hypothetical protein
MARHESDREDLFAEAVSLVRKLAGCIENGPLVVAGFRTDDVLVVYFGAEPMLQFDAAGRLRRAFADGCLYRCQGDTLARMVRDRSANETALVRHDLSPAELADFREQLRLLIQPLALALGDGRFAVTRRSPTDDQGLEAAIAIRLETALTVEDWISPAIRGKR